MNEPDSILDAREHFIRASETDDLLLPRCDSCSSWAWPPQEICGNCGTRRWHWESTSARGSLLSLARVWRGAGKDFQEDVPYDLALVRLEEGPEFITRAASDRLTSGDSVRLVWRTIAGNPWPCVVPE